MNAQNENSSQFLEKLVIGIFVVAGCIGFGYTMHGMTYRPPTDITTVSGFYRDDVSVHNLRKDAVHTKSAEQFESIQANINQSKSQKAYKQPMFISGDMEADSPVLFTIDEFASNASYYLDFGDGVIRELTHKSNAHVYAKPGNYKVKLSLHYQGKEAIVNQKNITIYPPIMVSMNATKIDF